MDGSKKSYYIPNKRSYLEESEYIKMWFSSLCFMLPECVDS